MGQASRVRGREKLGDDGVAFGIVDLGHRLRRAVRLRHGPAARQGQRPELTELVADLRLPGGIGGGEPSSSSRRASAGSTWSSTAYGSERAVLRSSRTPRAGSGSRTGPWPTTEMVEVHQRHQAVLAASVAEHRQQAGLIAEHVRQPPTGGDPHPADRGRPWRVGHAGRRQRRRRAEASRCAGVTRGPPAPAARPWPPGCRPAPRN